MWAIRHVPAVSGGRHSSLLIERVIPMGNLRTLFDRVDVSVTNWMARFGIMLLRVSLGIVFFWFGALKFFPGLSPAQDLAMRTIDILTFGLIPSDRKSVV